MASFAKLFSSPCVSHNLASSSLAIQSSCSWQSPGYSICLSWSHNRCMVFIILLPNPNPFQMSSSCRAWSTFRCVDGLNKFSNARCVLLAGWKCCCCPCLLHPLTHKVSRLVSLTTPFSFLVVLGCFNFRPHWAFHSGRPWRFKRVLWQWSEMFEWSFIQESPASVSPWTMVVAHHVLSWAEPRGEVCSVRGCLGVVQLSGKQLDFSF